VTDGSLLSILLIAIGLSADCFAIALSGGVSQKNHSWPRRLRVAFSFGVFQALMPVIGWLAGISVVQFISNFDHWVAFALLAIVGGKMLWESFRAEKGEEKETDITKGWMLVMLSVATSVDALAVGLSFAFLNVNIGLASGIIGAVAFVITMIGFVIAKRASKIIGKRAETLGGLILLAIAFRILLSHLLQ
jgi:putative Mn2+ efflux pump MntP